MKKNICGIGVLVCFLLMIGLVGAVENGAPLARMLWCAPCLIGMIYFGNKYLEEDYKK